MPLKRVRECKLKNVTRCYECSNRVYDFGVGFVPATTMMCGMIGIEVSPSDGCTFGEKGDGGYAVKECDIIIDSRAAVNGYHQYEE